MEDTEKQTTDLKADKKRLKDEKNKLKQEQKKQRKEARARAKEIALEEAQLDDDSEGNPCIRHIDHDRDRGDLASDPWTSDQTGCGRLWQQCHDTDPEKCTGRQ